MKRVYLNSTENEIVGAIGDLLKKAREGLSRDSYLMILDEVKELAENKEPVSRRDVMKATGLSEEEKRILGL